MYAILWCTSLVMLFMCGNVSASYAKVSLVNNKYTGVLVAIDPKVPQTDTMIDSIKTMITEASAFMFDATEKRAAFGDVTILVPRNWNMSGVEIATQPYSQADIVILEEDLLSTLSYRGCGEPGEKIQLSTKLIEGIWNYGPIGKVLLHFWAQLRWGVMEENGKFYLDSNLTPQAIRCPLALKGTYANLDGSACVLNTSTKLYEDDCVFRGQYVQPTGLSASIMSHQYVAQVTKFCHNNASDPVNLHNQEAPNKQNRFCGRRSTWEVVISSEDFASNQPNDALDLNVNFKVVQARSSPVYVLVLDVSASMIGTRLADMISAATAFLNTYAPNGSQVGIVEFSSTARTLSYLTQIDGNRNTLVSRLPTTASGYTCIGCGIVSALTMLNADTHGTNVIVLTDGGENEQPYVSTTQYHVLSKGICLRAIFFGESSQNAALQSLAESSCGSWFYSRDGEIGDLLSTFQATARNDDGDITKQQIQVSNDQVITSPGQNYTGTINIDSTIGNNTKFQFSYSSTQPVIELTSPDGERYCSSLVPAGCTSYGVVDSTVKTVVFTIPGTAKAGTWTYIVTSSLNQSVTVSVTSYAVSTTIDPIIVESGTFVKNVSNLEVFVIFTKVSQGTLKVTNATVEALVTTPTGVKVNIHLKDGGAVPDLEKSDGIYAAYFIPNEIGRHSIRVTVSGTGSSTRKSSDPTKRSRKRRFSPRLSSSGPSVSVTAPSVSSSDLDSFSRVEIPASFSATRALPAANLSALLGPSQIFDLDVVQTDLETIDKVTVTFTAPGDDLDIGTASRYDIRYSFTAPRSVSLDFPTWTDVTNAYATHGNVTMPKASGEVETFVVSLVGTPSKQNSLRVWFGVRAHDSDGNAADISNIAVVYMFNRNVAPPSTTSSTVRSTTSDQTTVETTTTSFSDSVEEPFPYLTVIIVLGIIAGVFILLFFLMLIIHICAKRRAPGNFNFGKPDQDQAQETHGNPYQLEPI